MPTSPTPAAARKTLSPMQLSCALQTGAARPLPLAPSPATWVLQRIRYSGRGRGLLRRLHTCGRGLLWRALLGSGWLRALLGWSLRRALLGKGLLRALRHRHHTRWRHRNGRRCTWALRLLRLLRDIAGLLAWTTTGKARLHACSGRKARPRHGGRWRSLWLATLGHLRCLRDLWHLRHLGNARPFTPAGTVWSWGVPFTWFPAWSLVRLHAGALLG